MGYGRHAKIPYWRSSTKSSTNRNESLIVNPDQPLMSAFGWNSYYRPTTLMDWGSSEE